MLIYIALVKKTLRNKVYDCKFQFQMFNVFYCETFIWHSKQLYNIQTFQLYPVSRKQKSLRVTEVNIKADPSLYSDLQNHIFMFIKCSISQYHLHLTWTEKVLSYCLFLSLCCCSCLAFTLLTFSLQFHLYWIVVTHFLYLWRH